MNLLSKYLFEISQVEFNANIFVENYLKHFFFDTLSRYNYSFKLFSLFNFFVLLH